MATVAVTYKIRVAPTGWGNWEWELTEIDDRMESRAGNGLADNKRQAKEQAEKMCRELTDAEEYEYNPETT